MNLKAFKSDITTAILSACISIKTVKIGYLTDLNTGQTEYDALVISPPKVIVEDTRATTGSRLLEIRWFHFCLDKDPDTGAYFTDDRRVEEWGNLTDKTLDILRKLQEAPDKFRIESNIEIDPNSGGEDQVIQDRVLWVMVTFRLRVSDCG